MSINNIKMIKTIVKQRVLTTYNINTSVADKYEKIIFNKIIDHDVVGIYANNSVKDMTIVDIEKYIDEVTKAVTYNSNGTLHVPNSNIQYILKIVKYKFDELKIPYNNKETQSVIKLNKLMIASLSLMKSDNMNINQLLSYIDGLIEDYVNAPYIAKATLSQDKKKRGFKNEQR